MMGGLCPRPGYQPLPQSHILEICPDNTVRVSTEDCREVVIQVNSNILRKYISTQCLDNIYTVFTQYLHYI